MAVNQSRNLRYMAIKAESTPGTYNAPADAEFDIRLRDIEVSYDIGIDNENSKYGNGSHAEDESISGAQMVTVTGNARVHHSGTDATEPKWFGIAKACGLATNAYTTVGIGLRPREAEDDTTYSVAIYDKELGESSPVTTIIQMAGVVGNMVLTAESIGSPWMVNFTLTGKLNDIVDGTALSIASTTQTALPEKFLNQTFTVNSAAERISSFALDLGNEITPVIDQSDATGYKHFAITARRPRFSCNPLAQKQATKDWLNEMLTDASRSVVLATPATGKVSMSIPDAQVLSLAESAREGLNAWDINFKCLQNGSPGSLTDSGLTLEDTFEILHGTRT